MSSGSDDAKGSSGSGGGSGGGYSGDCSSLDSSSKSANGKKTKAVEKGIGRLSVEEKSSEKRRSKEALSSSRRESSSTTRPLKSREKTEAKARKKVDTPSNAEMPKSVTLEKKNHRRQRTESEKNVVRDPRIDLSCVQHIRTNDLGPSLNARMGLVDRSNSPQDDDDPSSKIFHAPELVVQYESLMNAVRPFFSAHGLVSTPGGGEMSVGKTEDGGAHHDSASTGTQLLDAIPPAPVGSSRRSNELKVQPGSSSLTEPHANKLTTDSADRSKENVSQEADVDDSRCGLDDHPVQAGGAAVADRRELREEDPSHQLADTGDRKEGNDAELNPQESAASSSSEDRNNVAVAREGDPQRNDLPAVVSEYASSRQASSGASNTNGLSTSGSGSGGNSGSGTGSGSNPGSSGSGNDQVGGSSNGNGSSGSGNDVKNSSEETKGSSGENNSGENSNENSDASNGKLNKDSNAVAAAAAAGVNQKQDDTKTQLEKAQKDSDYAASNPPLAATAEETSAVRVRKLQDKKRKRMNMRREYEEIVQQEMESWESSENQGDVVIRPGRPVTLDKVLSFTKTARMVVKAVQPFLVVYTNAAYSRMSGIDSHKAVGKPITTLLSIPSIAPSVQSLSDSQMHPEILETTSNDLQERGVNQNHSQAEAAGRARAEASTEDCTKMSLERLVTICGFGQPHVLNVISKSKQASLGRSMSVTGASSHDLDEKEEASHGSSITSSSDLLYCNTPSVATISPVVSSAETYDPLGSTEKASEKDSHSHNSKRRKQRAQAHQSTTSLQPFREVILSNKRHLITHFVVELKYISSQQNAAIDSQSSVSSSFEAQMFGLTKAEIRSLRQNAATEGPLSESADANEAPCAAIG